MPPEQVGSAQEALDKSGIDASILPLDYSREDDEYERIQKGKLKVYFVFEFHLSDILLLVIKSAKFT